MKNAGVQTNEYCMQLTPQKWSVYSLYKGGCGGEEEGEGEEVELPKGCVIGKWQRVNIMMGRAGDTLVAKTNEAKSQGPVRCNRWVRWLPFPYIYISIKLATRRSVGCCIDFYWLLYYSNFSWIFIMVDLCQSNLIREILIGKSRCTPKANV